MNVLPSICSARHTYITSSILQPRPLLIHLGLEFIHSFAPTHLPCLRPSIQVQASGASLWFIVGGEVLVGCMGAASLFFMATFSMTIDSIHRSKRTLYIGLLEGTIYFGAARGPS
jgi:hypothetical protein